MKYAGTTWYQQARPKIIDQWCILSIFHKTCAPSANACMSYTHMARCPSNSTNPFPHTGQVACLAPLASPISSERNLATPGVLLRASLDTLGGAVGNVMVMTLASPPTLATCAVGYVAVVSVTPPPRDYRWHNKTEQKAHDRQYIHTRTTVSISVCFLGWDGIVLA